MADVREELRLCTVKLSECLCSSAFLFVGPRVGNGCCKVPCNKIQETAIVGIERPQWADSGDHESRRVNMAGREDRQDKSVSRRVGPRTSGRFSKTRLEIGHQLRCSAFQHPMQRPNLVGLF